MIFTLVLLNIDTYPYHFKGVNIAMIPGLQTTQILAIKIHFIWDGIQTNSLVHMKTINYELEKYHIRYNDIIVRVLSLLPTNKHGWIWNGGKHVQRISEAESLCWAVSPRSYRVANQILPFFIRDYVVGTFSVGKHLCQRNIAPLCTLKATETSTGIS